MEKQRFCNLLFYDRVFGFFCIVLSSPLFFLQETECWTLSLIFKELKKRSSSTVAKLKTEKKNILTVTEEEEEASCA